MQDYYTRSRANFRIKGAVAANPLVIVTDIDRVLGLVEENEESLDERNNHFQQLISDMAIIKSDSLKKRKNKYKRKRFIIKMMFYIYKFLRTLFTTIYFYFFPLFVIVIPFITTLYQSWFKISCENRSK